MGWGKNKKEKIGFRVYLIAEPLEYVASVLTFHLLPLILLYVHESIILNNLNSLSISFAFEIRQLK